MLRLCAAFLFLPFMALAQNVDVKNVDTSSTPNGETTTIEIRKGKAAEMKTDAQWEVTEGDADINGDAAPVGKEAKSNWDKACKEWKKEFRDDNKENKIISMSCGKADCSGDAGNKTCTSKATYKLKTKIN